MHIRRYFRFRNEEVTCHSIYMQSNKNLPEITITAPYFTALLVHIIESRHNWVFEYTVITVYSAKTSLFMRVYCTTRNYYDSSLPRTVLQCL